MKRILRIWARAEEIIMVTTFVIMTMVTLIYVLANNIYVPFLWLADKFPSISEFFTTIAFGIVSLAQSMTWSLAVTKLAFAWMIFIGTCYGVRTYSHIGLDIVTSKLPHILQKITGLIAVGSCIVFSLVMLYGSFVWTKTLYSSHITAEDLDHFGIQLWMISVLMPFSMLLLTIRFIEILIQILRGEINNVGSADEVKDSLENLDQYHTLEENK